MPTSAQQSQGALGLHPAFLSMASWVTLPLRRWEFARLCPLLPNFFILQKACHMDRFAWRSSLARAGFPLCLAGKSVPFSVACDVEGPRSAVRVTRARPAFVGLLVLRSSHSNSVTCGVEGSKDLPSVLPMPDLPSSGSGSSGAAGTTGAPSPPGVPFSPGRARLVPAPHTS